MIHQLNPPIPVITPKGPALAHMVIDYGVEHDLNWVCFQNSTGECWTWSNPVIRAQKNITQGRDYIAPFYNPDDVAFKDEDEEDEEDEEPDWEQVAQDHFRSYERERDMRKETEKSLEESIKKIHKIEKENEVPKATKKALFDLQDLLIRLLKFKKIDQLELTNVTSILMNTGVSKSDIDTYLGKIEKF